MADVATIDEMERNHTGVPWYERLEQGYDYVRPRRGVFFTGTVLEIHPELILVDIGAKRDGVVPSSDLKNLDEEVTDELAVGDEVPVLVQRTYDRQGDLILSLYRGQELRNWQEAQQLLEDGEIVELQVDGYNKGGVTVTFGQLRGFVPASHLAGLRRGMSQEEHRQALAAHVGRPVRLKVLEVDQARRRLVLSQREGLRAYRKKRREELLQSLSVGDVMTGKVSSLKRFGAFVDVGGADGLVHLTELSHGRVRHPEDVLDVGQDVDVQVIELDEKRQRIGLSIKRLLPDPWQDADQRYFSGQVVDVTITNLADFGAFARLEHGLEGLIHISRLAYNNVGHPRDVLSIGDEVQAVILHVDMKRKRVALSMRDVIQWIEASEAEEVDTFSQADETQPAQQDIPSSGRNAFSADLPDYAVAGLIITD